LSITSQDIVKALGNCGNYQHNKNYISYLRSRRRINCLSHWK